MLSMFVRTMTLDAMLRKEKSGGMVRTSILR
jgi:hypothetical protein